MINQEMHNYTKDRIPRLKEQVFEEINKIHSFLYECNEKNWDSYNADPITIETVKYTVEVLEEIGKWFEKNIGFLNNRTLKFETGPLPSGNIHIDICYDNLFIGWFFVKYGEPIDCTFKPKPRFMMSGTKTIADRDFLMVFSKDKMNLKTFGFDKLHSFLDEVFYEHKWKFIPDYDHYNHEYIKDDDKEIFSL